MFNKRLFALLFTLFTISLIPSLVWAPPAIPFIVVAITYAAGAMAAAGTISATAAALITIGVGIAGTVSAMMLAKKPGDPNPIADNSIKLNGRSATDPIRVWYGKNRVGGTWFFRKPSGPTNNWMNILVGWGEGECEGVAYDVEPTPAFSTLGVGKNDLETGGDYTPGNGPNLIINSRLDYDNYGWQVEASGVDHFNDPLNGWTWTANKFTHTPGGVPYSVYEMGMLGHLIVGKTYRLTFTVSGRTVGSVRAYLGGVTGTLRSADGSYTQDFLCSDAAQTLIFTPSSDFNGSIQWIVCYEYSTADWNFFAVEIDNQNSNPQTFRWSRSGAVGGWDGEGIQIPANNAWYNLSNGVKIRFPSQTGHELYDRWNFYAGLGIYHGDRMLAYWQHFFSYVTWTGHRSPGVMRNVMEHWFHNGASNQTYDTNLVNGGVSHVLDAMGIPTTAQGVPNATDNYHNLCYSFFRLAEDKYQPSAWDSGIQDFQIILKGVKIYDPRTSTTVYSRNPALVWRDWMTNARYSLGISTAYIDDASVIAAANWCDPSAVTRGGTYYTCIKNNTNIQPGITAGWDEYWFQGDIDGCLHKSSPSVWSSSVDYTAGYFFDGGLPVQAEFGEHLDAIMASFRAYMIWSGGKYKIKIYTDDAPAMTLKEADVIVGPSSFQWNRPGVDEQKNKCIAWILDAFDGYKSTSVNYEDSVKIALDGEEKKLELQINGTHDFIQAQKIAKYSLLRTIYGDSITLQCHPRCYALEPGNMVQVTHEFPNWANPSVVTNGGNYYVCIYPHTSAAGDQPGVGANWQARWLLSSLAEVTDIFSGLGDIESGSTGSAWGLGNPYTSAKKLRVKSIGLPQNGLIPIVFLDENAQIYDENVNTAPRRRNGKIVDNSVFSAPTGLTVDSKENQNTPNVIDAYITWSWNNMGAGIDYYLIYRRAVTGTTWTSALIKDPGGGVIPSYRIEGLECGVTYEYYMYAFLQGDRTFMSPYTAMATVTTWSPDLIDEDDILYLTKNVEGRFVILTWEFVGNPSNLYQWRIYRAESSTPPGDSDWLDVKSAQTRTYRDGTVREGVNYWYWLKAEDKNGNLINSFKEFGGFTFHHTEAPYIIYSNGPWPNADGTFGMYADIKMLTLCDTATGWLSGSSSTPPSITIELDTFDKQTGTGSIKARAWRYPKALSFESATVDGQSLGASGSTLYRVQGFKIPSGTVVCKAVGLKLRKVGNPGNITVDIRNDSAGAPGTVRVTTSLSSSLIGTSYGVDPKDYAYAVFGSTTSLVSGTLFWLVLSYSGDGSNFYALQNTLGDTNLFGDASEKHGYGASLGSLNWKPLSDMNFRICIAGDAGLKHVYSNSLIEHDISSKSYIRSWFKTNRTGTFLKHSTWDNEDAQWRDHGSGLSITDAGTWEWKSTDIITARTNNPERFNNVTAAGFQLTEATLSEDLIINFDYMLANAGDPRPATQVGVSGPVRYFVLENRGKDLGTILIGGIEANEDLTLQSTEHATKGYINLGLAGTSYFNEATNDLIITGNIAGGDASGGNLVLTSTIHNTKGLIYFGAYSYINESGGSLAIIHPTSYPMILAGASTNNNDAYIIATGKTSSGVVVDTAMYSSGAGAGVVGTRSNHNFNIIMNNVNRLWFDTTGARFTQFVVCPSWIFGSESANGNLNLCGTTNGTRTSSKIYFGAAQTSYFEETGGHLTMAGNVSGAGISGSAWLATPTIYGGWGAGATLTLASSYDATKGAINMYGNVAIYNGGSYGYFYYPLGYATAVGGSNKVAYIDSTGLVGYLSSSERFKDNIIDLNSSDRLYLLRPVSFEYKTSRGIKQLGFIAEEVEPFIPEVVTHDVEGKPDGINFPGLVPLLVSEVQKLRERIIQLEGRS